MGIVRHCDRCKGPIDPVRLDHAEVNISYPTPPNKHARVELCPDCTKRLDVFLAGQPLPPQPTRRAPKPKAKRRGK